MKPAEKVGPTVIFFQIWVNNMQYLKKHRYLAYTPHLYDPLGKRRGSAGEAAVDPVENLL